MRAKVCNKYANCGPVRREYATPLWCRPMIKFLAWQEESGLWPKIAVVSVCWQQQLASRHPGSKAARSSSFFPITNYAYAMLDCNWWQGRTPHTAHSSRSPWPHLKLPLQALAQNFACHTCVCNCHAPQHRLDKEAKRWWCEQISIMSSATCAAHLHVCWHA